MLVVAALLLDLLLGWACFADRPPVAVYPLVPPLTRIAALGDHPLGAGAPAAPPGMTRLLSSRIMAKLGTAEEKRAMADIEEQGRQMSSFREQGATLRMALEADAQVIAGALGRDRVVAIIAAKHDLARRYGEGRMWAQTAVEVGR